MAKGPAGRPRARQRIGALLNRPVFDGRLFGRGLLGRTAFSDRPLAFAVAVSLLLHGLVMFIRFAPPLPVRFAPSDPRLEVVLVNAKTPNRPLNPEVLAQVDMEGGGEHDSGRATSPLPAEARAEDGTALQRQRARVEELQQEQRRLLALAQGSTGAPETERTPAERPRPQAEDREDTEAVIARLQAQIDKQIADYNKRPRRLTYGVNAVGVNYARYVDDWAQRIEKIGTQRYPPEARGRMYDSLVITVEIDKHGNVVDVIINKKSRYDALNRAIKQIVYAGAPYERFSPEMAREGDILQIVRTWTFTNNTLETKAVAR